MKNRKGFTLVEIMIVVAIIALLAAIAIPNLLRAKMAANDALAQGTLRTLSTSSETYATANSGTYPADMAALTGSTPPYMSRNYENTTLAGYKYTALWSGSGYTFTATPGSTGTSGTTVYTMTTGGVLVPPN